MKSISVAIEGHEIIMETGRIARQAHGSVLLRYGGTVLLATVVAADHPRPGAAFFPLTVEYREKMAAAGRIPGGFLRREGRITDAEVLTSRLVDRTIRPLFPGGYLNETQVCLTVFSADEQRAPDGVAILAASAALHVSTLPWRGPVAGVPIARVGGTWHLFPSRAHRLEADIDLMVSGDRRGVAMVEGGALEAKEEEIIEGIERARDACRTLCDGLDGLRDRADGDTRVFVEEASDEQILAAVDSLLEGKIDALLEEQGKAERRAMAQALESEAVEELAAEDPEKATRVADAVRSRIKRAVRRRIALDEDRPDGRRPEEIRPIWCEVGWLPRCHGSAIFTRGQTQALVSCTLGGRRDEQMVESLEGLRKESFLLHYNFPAYSVGEVGPNRGPGRREIGHGHLAHRALEPVLPKNEDFAYTLRLVSDVSESNGSSSMATVCGGTLALMDAGVPIDAPVAGIAMGLVREDEKYTVLSDILGEEDHLGDMDFKVAGTRAGITAIQMDNKLGSIPAEVMSRALDQARRGRIHILDQMRSVLDEPRDDVSSCAPRISSLRIRSERIRDLIGPGGRHIQALQNATGATVDVSDDGLVRICAPDAAASAAAVQKVRNLTLEPEVGEVYRGTVVGVKDFAAFVKISETVEGRVHLSEVDDRRIQKVGDVLAEGDSVVVEVIGVDRQGKIALSRKAAVGKEPTYQ